MALVASLSQEDTQVVEPGELEVVVRGQMISEDEPDVLLDPQPSVVGSSYGPTEELSATFRLYSRYYR